jgi:multiple sugar transport system substrate-binding protein
MERRQFLVGAGGLGLLGLLAACASPSIPAGSSEVAFFNDVPTWSPGFQAANKYLKTLAGGTLAPRSVPTSASYQQVIQSQLQTTNPPDVAKWGSGYQLQDIARTGTLYPLDDVWKESIAKGWVPAELQDIFKYQGKTYAMPLQQGYYVMFYNVQLFDKLGIAAPTTWDEFLAACTKLKSAGITPLGATQVNSWPIAVWMSVFALSYDAAWYRDLCSNRAKWSDPKGIAFLTLWRDWIEKGWFTSADSVIDDFPSLMQKGKLGMFAEAVSWETQSIDVTGLKATTGYDTFILPNMDGSKTTSIITETAGLIVPRKGPNRSRTVEILRHWLDPRPQHEWSDFLSGSSANPEVAWSNAPSRRIQKIVQDSSLEIANRYYENSPPALINGNLQDLGGFMAAPGDVHALASGMDARGDTEWKYWHEETAA